MTIPDHESPGNGFRDPFRYITLAILTAILIYAVVSAKDLGAISGSIKDSNTGHLNLGTAIERIVTNGQEQNYLLDQLLPEGRRIGLGMPPTLRKRVEEFREYRGEPWGRRRPAQPGDEQARPPGDPG